MKILDRSISIQGRVIRTGRLEAESFDTFPDPVAMVGALRQADIHMDLFTFIEPLRKSWEVCDYPWEWDNLAACQLTTFEDWWTNQIDGKTRNMVRRSEKVGLEVREAAFDDAFVRGISAIYNDSEIRQGKRFKHYGKDLETVRRENGTFLARSVYIGAFLGDEMIGFAKVVSDERGQQAGLMQIVSMSKHRDKAPSNALIAQAVRSCAAREIPYLFYSHFSYGKKQGDSLSDFKRHNGFRRVDLRRYFVPLTLVGRAALRLGVQHGRLIDYIPESLQTQLRNLRHRLNGRTPVARQTEQGD